MWTGTSLGEDSSSRLSMASEPGRGAGGRDPAVPQHSAVPVWRRWDTNGKLGSAVLLSCSSAILAVGRESGPGGGGGGGRERGAGGREWGRGDCRGLRTPHGGRCNHFRTADDGDGRGAFISCVSVPRARRRQKEPDHLRIGIFAHAVLHIRYLVRGIRSLPGISR